MWVRIRPALLDEIERLAALQGREPGQLLSLFLETGMLIWADDGNAIMPHIVD